MNKAPASDKFDFTTFANYASQRYLSLHNAETDENGEYVHADWLMTFEYNRDSGAYTQANLQVIREELEPHGDDWIEMEFNHPACGWIAFIVCKPESKALEIVAEAMCTIEDFPLLDEHRELVFHCTRCGTPNLSSDDNTVWGQDGRYCNDECHRDHEQKGECKYCGTRVLESDEDHLDNEDGMFCDNECHRDHLIEIAED